MVCSALLAAWTPPTSSRSSPSSTRTGSISFRKILKQSCNVQSNTAFPFFFAHILKNNLTKISWFFLQDDRVVAVGVCFSILDYSIYIPELILVRIQRSKQYCYIFQFNFSLISSHLSSEASWKNSVLKQGWTNTPILWR